MISRLKNIFIKGTSSSLTAHERKAIILTNFLVLIASLVAILRFVIYYNAGDESYAYISLIAGLVFGSLYFVNTKGYHDVAKFTLIIVGNLATGYKELQLGGDGGQLYLILASFGLNFFFFDLRQKFKLFIALSISMINLSLVLFIPDLIVESPLTDIEKSQRIIGAFSNVIITVLVMYYFSKKSSDIESELIDTNSELQEINQEKERINEELVAINDDLITQKNIIEQKNEEIFASIRYAKRIQSAFLPSDSKKPEILKNLNLIFRPKDIVSGDYYWWGETRSEVFICTADCTGHGVPAAMLSMLGMVAINDAIHVLGIKDLDLVMEYMDNYMKEHIKKEEADKLRDGVELSFFKINKETNKIWISGAKRPTIIYHDNEIEYYQASRRYIGDENRQNHEYQNIEVPYKEGMVVYQFTDGLADQSNPDRKKFGTKRIKEFVKENGDKPVDQQISILDKTLKDHMQDEDQRDDITVIAFRV